MVGLFYSVVGTVGPFYCAVGLFYSVAGLFLSSSRFFTTLAHTSVLRYKIVVTGETLDGLPDICAEIHFDIA